MSHKILVAQGGGPTAVINQSLAGVALEARRFPDVSHVYGALQGVRGIVNDDLVDLGQETVANLEAVAATPAAALGSTRDKPDRKYCQEIFKVLKAHAIDTFFYIGGNDSSDTVRIVAEEAKTADHKLQRHPYPQDDRQRSRRLRPYAGLPLGGALRRAGLRRRQSRQSGAQGRLCRRGDGPARGLPHRGLGARAQISRRRPASHLSARAHLRRRQVPRRREGDLRAPRPLHRRGLRGHSRREGRGDHHQAHGRSRRRTRTATSSSPAPARSPISCARR